MSATHLAKLVLGASLILFGCALLMDTLARPAHGVGFDVCAVGCRYTTIQQAVDATASGGTVMVGPGNYVETVTIAKPLTLRGAGLESTVAGARTDANGYRTALTVSAPDVTIDGFLFGPQVPDTAHSTVGVMVTGAARTTLRNTQYRNLLIGVNADRASGLQIDGSTFTAGSIGIGLMASTQSAIGTHSPVRFMNSTYAAIDLETATDTLIQRIELTNVARAIVAFGSDRTTISGVTGSVGVTGFELGNDQGFGMSDVVLSGGSGSGIRIDGQNGPSSDVSLLRSTFTGFANRLTIGDGALSTPLVESGAPTVTPDSTSVAQPSAGAAALVTPSVTAAAPANRSGTATMPTLLPATGSSSGALPWQLAGPVVAAVAAAGSGVRLLHRY